MYLRYYSCCPRLSLLVLFLLSSLVQSVLCLLSCPCLLSQPVLAALCACVWHLARVCSGTAHVSIVNFHARNYPCVTCFYLCMCLSAPLSVQSLCPCLFMFMSVPCICVCYVPLEAVLLFVPLCLHMCLYILLSVYEIFSYTSVHIPTLVPVSDPVP